MDNEHTRLRGRRGVKQRLDRLRAEPLCRACSAQGRVRISTTPDHIIPLARGGTDDDGNIQCLCAECHAIKTAGESSDRGYSLHPAWLKPATIPTTIIAGPPCAGKTTHAKNAAANGDIIIDLDVIFAGVKPDYQQWSGTSLDRETFAAGIRTRNAMLGSLSRRKSGRAWFIVMAPTEGERKWWCEKLGAAPLLLNPGIEECKRRAAARGVAAVDGVAAWFRSAKLRWSAPNRIIGPDGYPVDD